MENMMCLPFLSLRLFLALGVCPAEEIILYMTGSVTNDRRNLSLQLQLLDQCTVLLYEAVIGRYHLFFRTYKKMKYGSIH